MLLRKVASSEEIEPCDKLELDRIASAIDYAVAVINDTLVRNAKGLDILTDGSFEKLKRARAGLLGESNEI